MLKRLLHHPGRHVLPVVLLVAAPAAALAQQPAAQQPPAQQQPAAQQQREHTVRRGDTLWDLARAYLNNPFQWPLIYEANRDVVENPHWIYPAERLIIPPVLQRTGVAVEPPVLPAAVITESSWPTGEPVVTATPRQTVIPSAEVRRPVVSPGEYVRLPWVSAEAQAALTGRIAAKADPAAAADRMAPALYPNERVHVSITAGAVAVGDSLLVVREGRRVGTWGSVVEPLALLRVESVTGATATARIVGQFGDARVGDPVMPMTPVPPIGMGAAEPVDGGVQAQLVEFLVPQPLYSTTDLAFLSIGAADGVGIGDEFAVYVPAAGAFPAEQVAVVRVVRTAAGTSTARVLSVNSVALREGLPVTLIRKMP